jgi:membrane protein DedA with SNARE-associated domain
VSGLEQFLEHFTYLGIFTVLLLGSLGVPIPEEMPIIAAGVLAYEGVVRGWLVLLVCVVGVVSGDVVLYWVGWHWGERVLQWRVVRLVLSPAREHWLKAAYRRHAITTVIAARPLTGLRAAAFVTAGIARVPFWKFLCADVAAALVSVPLLFAGAYFFTDEIQAVVAGARRAERWLGLAVLVVMVLILFVAWRRLQKERNKPPAPRDRPQERI